MPPIRLRACLLLACLAVLSACQSAPKARVQSARFDVRAGERAVAERISRACEELAPRLVELVPDTELPELSVWIQELPTLYEFPLTTLPEADGFYAPDHRRIHLRQSAPDLERTLAHEMVHAALGPSWSSLPGTIEEGLCDAVSVELMPQSRARLRAGRYCAAAFGMGGLRLSLRIRTDALVSPDGLTRELEARVRLEGERRESVDPISVFEAQAGSASAKLSVSRKKALYGYADLIVDRILERRGYAGLHRIATTARQQGRTQIPRQWLLDAAELTRDPESWQQALLEGLGPQELEELVRMQPMLLGDMLVDFLLPLPQGADLDALLGGTSMTICAQPEAASINLLAIPEFRHSVRARLARLQDKADS